MSKNPYNTEQLTRTNDFPIFFSQNVAVLWTGNLVVYLMVDFEYHVCTIRFEFYRKIVVEHVKRIIWIIPFNKV